MYLTLEFDLPGFDRTDSVGQDVADCPTPVSRKTGTSEETDGPTSDSGLVGQTVGNSMHSQEGHIVTQATDEPPSPTFVFTSSDTDHTDAAQEATRKTLEEIVKSLPNQQQAVLSMLLEDLNSKKCEIDLDKRTGHVKVRYPVRAKAPEDTLRITNASSYLSPRDQIEDFCALLDHIKLNICPSGVVLDRSEVRPGFAKKYREGKEYSIAETVLGEGLNAKVRVTLDKGTKKSQAMKEVRINLISSDEIRAMTDLNDSGITPKLFLCQLDQDNVQLYMEIVDSSVTIEEVIKQLACIMSRESDVENLLGNIQDIHQFALYVCTETFKAVRHLHQLGWFHKDLHGGNVLLQCVNEEEVRIRILDLGSAAFISLREHETSPLLEDVTNLLRQFASLYLVGDWFENIFDFKRYYVERITGSQLGEEQKAFLISIVKDGLEVNKEQQEKDFISGLENKLEPCSKNSVRRVVGMLEFEHSTANTFQDLHIGQQPLNVGGSEIQAQDVQALQMNPVVSQLKNIHLAPSKY